jgi:hypothetical protein
MTSALRHPDPRQRIFMRVSPETVESIRRCFHNDNPTEEDRINVVLWLLFATEAE